MVWVGPLARSGIGAEVAVPKAGSAVIHDDAGNIDAAATRFANLQDPKSGALAALGRS